MNLLETLIENNYQVKNPDIIVGVETSAKIEKWEGESHLSLMATTPNPGMILLHSIDSDGEFEVASNWSGTPRATCACPSYEMWVNNPHWGSKNGKLICR